MHEVSTSRGASGNVRERQICRLPASWVPGAKIMCGTMPFAHWPRSSALSSPAARAGSCRARPIATKHESQSHWWG